MRRQPKEVEEGTTACVLRLATITVVATQSEEARLNNRADKDQEGKDKERERVISELGQVQLKSVPGKMSKLVHVM